MRKNIVAGNWKMNKDLSEGLDLLDEIKSKASNSAVELILIPPFIHLSEATKRLNGSPIQLGAQNVHAQSNGAFTGEISAAMLKSCGVNYCLVGHSERRTYQQESDEELLAKIKQLLEQGIRPILCCGEQLEDRKNGKHQAVVCQQLELVKQLNETEFSSMLLAYEPVWAIGTGETASAAQAQEMHACIRDFIADCFSAEPANETSILYGGSCNPGNAVELFSQPDVDGGLIGGASLIADDFIALSQSF